ncbi:MAG: tRNA (adenosine(37)-N6)-dimethylallyltransferase MiaA [Leptospira sp.]|nr:tRNA (adenosine(37)-N6)-dimethylallyltransferase MiaA [Leptospira sp.]
MNSKSLLPILAGPTGSGKTSLVCNLSSDLFEVVSFDSRQVYKDLPIGTTLPTPNELNQMPHWNIGLVTADVSLDANMFALWAKEAILKIWEKGKIPILVCGTGFYLRAFLNGMYPVPTITPEIKFKAQNMDLVEAVEIIRKEDKLALQNIDVSDSYRIKRILEVILSGALWTEISKQTVGGFLSEYPNIETRGYWIDWQRPELYARINERARTLVSGGMIEETELVLKKYGENCPGLKSLGYNFALDYLNRKIDINSFIEGLAQSHRNYAKRQITWFRKDSVLSPVSWQEALNEFQNIEKI